MDDEPLVGGGGNHYAVNARWPVFINEIDPPPAVNTTHHLNKDMKPTKKKSKHYTQEERQLMHNPVPDFVQSKRGEILKNSCTLDISDIINKHGISMA